MCLKSVRKQMAYAVASANASRKTRSILLLLLFFLSIISDSLLQMHAQLVCNF